MGSIYKITNTVNGKVYIGQTIQHSVSRRFYRHFNGTGNPHIAKDIAKYGLDAFSVEVIHENVMSEWLNHLENEAIKSFNAAHPRGYNIVIDGRQRTPSEETRLKLSTALKGRKQSPDHIQKRTEPRKGVPRPVETRQKISIAHTGKKLSEEHKRNIGESSKGRKMPDDHPWRNPERQTGANNHRFGKPADNRRPEYSDAEKMFYSFPSEMPLPEKRKRLHVMFPDVPKHSTLCRWTHKWQSELTAKGARK